ncbi:MAG: hypothetical protein FRX49_10279 [Trebouxia sp. A1-2]|nr:MAG: hypothetical protein FRX49_10279 [Trebouxia sp. A1-2]
MAATSQILTAHAPTLPGVPPAPRIRVTVPEAFASQGTSAGEHEQLSTHMQAVKMTPPDKSADDNGRDTQDVSELTQPSKLSLIALNHDCGSHGQRNGVAAHTVQQEVTEAVLQLPPVGPNPTKLHKPGDSKEALLHI